MIILHASGARRAKGSVHWSGREDAGVKPWPGTSIGGRAGRGHAYGAAVDVGPRVRSSRRYAHRLAGARDPIESLRKGIDNEAQV